MKISVPAKRYPRDCQTRKQQWRMPPKWGRPQLYSGRDRNCSWTGSGWSKGYPRPTTTCKSTGSTRCSGSSRGFGSWAEQRRRESGELSTTKLAAQTFSQGKKDTCVDDIGDFESADASQIGSRKRNIWNQCRTLLRRWQNALSVVNMILSNN